MHKDAFAEGFKKVFNLDTNIDVVHHHGISHLQLRDSIQVFPPLPISHSFSYPGSTDPLIIIKVLEHHGVKKEEAMAHMEEIKAVMNDHFVSHRCGMQLCTTPI